MIQIINPAKTVGRSAYGGTILNFNTDGVAEVEHVNPGLERWLRTAGYTLVDLDDPQEAENAIVFNPADHKVEEVLAYLADADEAERDRVLSAEAGGKNRASIIGKPDMDGKADGGAQ